MFNRSRVRRVIGDIERILASQHRNGATIKPGSGSLPLKEKISVSWRLPNLRWFTQAAHDFSPTSLERRC